MGVVLTSEEVMSVGGTRREPALQWSSNLHTSIKLMILESWKLLLKPRLHLVSMKINEWWNLT
jgi:hypothetical protein